MKHFFLLILLLLLPHCSNPSHVIVPFQFLFQSDLNSIGLNQIHLKLSAELSDQIIDLDSSSFFVCPSNNDTCDGRFYFEEVPGYTQTVPMTTTYTYTFADGEISLKILLGNSTDTVINNSIIIDRRSHGWYLIYLGPKYDENTEKIKIFLTCFPANRPDLKHVSFRINNSPSVTDSLYLIWFD